MKKSNESVCLLLIIRGNKVMVEPFRSNNFGQHIVRGLSHKFVKNEEKDLPKAIDKLVKKYNLSGIYNKTEKIELTKTFSINKKNFYVYMIRDEDKPIQLTGNFCFINKNELIEQEKVILRGTGKCLVTESLKIALS